jgi:hypothetical protein
MKNQLSLALLATCVVGPVLADEVPIPKFSNPPMEYKSQYEDKLLVGNRTAKSLLFWLNVSGPNGHQCYLTGNATSGNGQTYRYADDAANGCFLSIVLVEHSAVIIDSDNRCHEAHCGTRAYFNGAVLSLKK